MSFLHCQVPSDELPVCLQPSAPRLADVGANEQRRWTYWVGRDTAENSDDVNTDEVTNGGWPVWRLRCKPTRADMAAMLDAYVRTGILRLPHGGQYFVVPFAGTTQAVVRATTRTTTRPAAPSTAAPRAQTTKTT